MPGAAASPLPVRFFVPGEPQPKERPRTVRLKKNGQIVTFTPRSTLDYEGLVRRHAQRALALARWRRPTAEDRFYLALELHLGTARHKDLDDVLKAVQDGLAGVAFLNDWHVAQLLVRRVLRAPRPGVYVTLSYSTEVYAS
jgi:Holliday junction resolvase RusA-like endonuclease